MTLWMVRSASGGRLADEATRQKEIANPDDEVDKLQTEHEAVRAVLDCMGRAQQDLSQRRGPAVHQTEAGGGQTAA